jgi:hypothetical protein
MKDLTVVLDPHDPDGLQLKLRRRLVNAISRGVLCPAGRLPSSRWYRTAHCRRDRLLALLRGHGGGENFAIPAQRSARDTECARPVAGAFRGHGSAGERRFSRTNL